MGVADDAQQQVLTAGFGLKFSLVDGAVVSDKEDCACRGTDRRLTISTALAGAKDEDIVFPEISLTGAYAGS
jgi:hypothetical protein